MLNSEQSPIGMMQEVQQNEPDLFELSWTPFLEMYQNFIIRSKNARSLYRMRVLDRSNLYLKMCPLEWSSTMERN
mgnify:CR=1 FL=1